MGVPIHVQDCARALIHLAERGEVGGRYFLVNDDPVRLSDFAVTFARRALRGALHRRLTPPHSRDLVSPKPRRA